jgi:general secretion pathway protein J
MRRRSRGFTLVEVLVSSVILAVLGVLAHRGVADTRIAVERTREHMTRVREVQRAITLMVSDFRQVAPRPVRETIGDGYRPALFRDPNGTSLVEISRAGWPNTAGTPRGTVQRVVYTLENGVLIRRHWTVTDPVLATEPIRRELLKEVRSVEIRYLNSGRQWLAEWPELGSAGGTELRARPLAVEIVVELEDYGQIRRLVEVPG